MTERVEVWAKFTQAKIIPIAFFWRGRRYAIARIALCFERKDGGKRYLVFSVDTGGMMVQLVFDSVNMVWSVTGSEAAQ